MVEVKYKYQNEAEVIINQADNYTVNYAGIVHTHWKAYGTYYDSIAGQSRVCRSDELSFNSGSVYQTPIVFLRDRGLWLLQVPNGNRHSLIETTIPASEINNLNLPDLVIPSPYPTYPANTVFAHTSPPNIAARKSTGDIFTYLEWVKTAPNIAFFHPVGGKASYRLEIYQGNTLVFSRTETYQPQYVQVVGGCPSNTCPVLCGNGVCCYGSDGIAVSSYEY